MAGEWIKFEASTPEKREVFAITVAMGWDDPDLTVGKLLKVWRWFDQQTVDGNAPSVTAPLLDKIIGVTGFAQAMCDVGWLVSDSSGLALPNFDRHNGQTAKSRALTAKRVAKHKLNAQGNDEGNADSVSGALPREEKRREEKKEGKKHSDPAGSLVGKDDADAPPAPPSPDDNPNCPHQEIIALYHEILPMCPRIREWTPARAGHLRARWNENKKRQSLDYWRQFFEYVKTCPFLVGQRPGTGGRPFFADLEWIVKSSNFTKIREQRYES